MLKLDLEYLAKFSIKDFVKYYRSHQETLIAMRGHLDKAVAAGKVSYGVNTGFGALAQTIIDATKLEQLQSNLILSHAVGTGPSLSKEISRLMLVCKIQSLAYGNAGISAPVFNRLLDFLEQDLIPVVPEQGSLGASGDLAPLAHLSAPLIGFGKFWDATGSKQLAAKLVLEESGLDPVQLQAKDGISLLNGTEMMLACGATAVLEITKLLKIADLNCLLALEALHGHLAPFDRRIHAVRPHPGQMQVAENILRLLQGSSLINYQQSKVQDPYSLRCVPQVHGASRDALSHVRTVIERELNAVTGNPLVFADGAVLSGGNFHGQPLALALDYAAIAIAEIANISERRIYLLLSGYADLPKFLIKDSGLNSGLMIPQYTAASRVSENKVLCHPASVDSIPTSLGQEDHVSMGSISASKLLRVVDNVTQVLAIELLTATQALDFRTESSTPEYKFSPVTTEVRNLVRSKISHLSADRYLYDDLEQAIQIVESSTLVQQAEALAGPLH